MGRISIISLSMLMYCISNDFYAENPTVKRKGAEVWVLSIFLLPEFGFFSRSLKPPGEGKGGKKISFKLFA